MSFSQWSESDTVNIPICTVANKQETPTITSDGTGGAIIVWADYRTDAGNIYAQRIDSFGYVRWTSGGVAICTTQNKQLYPKIISDGKGGAIIVWDDQRTGNYSGNIYAQRINGNGQVLWTTNGVLVRNPVAYSPVITTDGDGGAIIAWRDDRAGSVDVADIYAQRIDSSGTLKWTPATGVPICTSAGQQLGAIIVSDDSGGAVIAWQYTRSDGTPNIYAQRVNSSGQVKWTANGVPIAVAAGYYQQSPSMINVNGGAIISWVDSRFTNRMIFAQRVNAFGAIQWTSGGFPVSNALWDISTSPGIVSDGTGGAIVAYVPQLDYYNSDIYAQRINNSGIRQWNDTTGIAVCSTSNAQDYPKLLSDGSGGAFIVWRDANNYDYNLYAQRINSLGVAQWALNGRPVTTAKWGQYSQNIVSARNNGLIVAWDDERNSYDQYNIYHDIYAQRLNANGTLTDVKDNEVFYRTFRLEQNYPNPFNPTTTIQLDIPKASFVTLKVYNVLGQEVATLLNEDKKAGRYEVKFSAEGGSASGGDGSKLASGVYFYCLTAGQFIETKKLILIK